MKNTRAPSAEGVRLKVAGAAASDWGVAGSVSAPSWLHAISSKIEGKNACHDLNGLNTICLQSRVDSDRECRKQGSNTNHRYKAEEI
jgi:hypothetical protein